MTYFYWDGSGHRRSITLKKGNTITQFLYRCLEQLRKRISLMTCKLMLIKS